MKANPKVLIVTPQNEDSRWVMISNSDELLAEDKTPNEVFANIKSQENKENSFLMFIPQKGVTHIY